MSDISSSYFSQFNSELQASSYEATALSEKKTAEDSEVESAGEESTKESGHTTKKSGVQTTQTSTLQSAKESSSKMSIFEEDDDDDEEDFNAAGSPTLETAEHPSIYSLLDSMGDLTLKKNEATLRALENENANMTEMNDNALDSANIQLDSAIQQKKDIEDALKKAEKQKTTNLIISSTIMAATAVALVVAVALIPATAGAATPIAIALATALVSQAIVMTVMQTQLTSPDGPIKNDDLRLAVSVIILVLLIALAVGGGVAAAPAGSAVAIGLLAGGSAAAGGLGTSGLMDNAFIVDQKNKGSSHDEAVEKLENFNNSETKKIIDYTLLAVSLVLIIASVGVGFAAGSTAAEGATSAASNTAGSMTDDAAQVSDDAVTLTDDASNAGSQGANAGSTADDLARLQAEASTGTSTSKASANMEQAAKNAEKEAMALEKAKGTVTRITSYNQILQSLMNMGQGGANMYFDLELAKTQKDIAEAQAASAFFSSANSFFESAASTVSKGMQETTQSATTISDMFNSLIKNVSRINYNIAG